MFDILVMVSYMRAGSGQYSVVDVLVENIESNRDIVLVPLCTRENRPPEVRVKKLSLCLDSSDRESRKAQEHRGIKFEKTKSI